MQEMQVQSLGPEDPLEKERAIHSSILAWEIHGQRSLTRYSPRSHKIVGHNLATKHHHLISLHVDGHLVHFQFGS